ncbi:hypothetical protein [Blastopirellula retiformator]|uniref:Uncharacterized protein n=1 Tax=Blastopirellula retiformator TaxID=2527970 RepID=A0A5C5VKX0_9BACT|nr:hypothetical protein [Blastopirellula retiformator]TWT38681.1 hypothetical protein Enr8_03740 [Blastopirellula retiformator]
MPGRDNRKILFGVRWGIRIVCTTAVIVGLILFVQIFLQVRRATRISANIGRLYQISLAVRGQHEDEGSPFADATPEETWKTILSRRQFYTPEGISSIFKESLDPSAKQSDIFAIRLPGEPPQYELICVEHRLLLVPLDDPSLLTANELAERASNLIERDPAAAESFLIRQRDHPEKPVEMTLEQYLNQLPTKP